MVGEGRGGVGRGGGDKGGGEESAKYRAHLWFKFKRDMSPHSSGSDSRFRSNVIIIQGRERRVQTNNVHESVIWHGRKLEVTGDADGRGKHRRVGIVFWRQRNLMRRKKKIQHCINSFTL